ncbi:hypothetical protein PGTUg99_015385 [Puccinia graminis f. sp. tritici]|uniref:Uncharacterized protein n=1 Tax=Puccinia graminis f. sp. tritici TaxID=56615 RepID=A0A5B0RY33_PUCGR|nr:hypothetical protein PGTUg99_015385 [Puccinia graminis f. sp. tritici]
MLKNSEKNKKEAKYEDEIDECSETSSKKAAFGIKSGPEDGLAGDSARKTEGVVICGVVEGFGGSYLGFREMSDESNETSSKKAAFGMKSGPEDGLAGDSARKTKGIVLCKEGRPCSC